MVDNLIKEGVNRVIVLGAVDENCSHSCAEKRAINEAVAIRIDLSKFNLA
jgi:dihydrodipicolinate synthase/N-acetylneuraminate lyase